MKGKIKVAIGILVSTVVVCTAVLLIIFLSGFHVVDIQLDARYNEWISEEEAKDKGHAYLLSEYDTESTMGFLNKDGTKTLYVFASPIRYLDTQGNYQFIDTRINNCEDTGKQEEGYCYTAAANAITPYFPDKLSAEKGVLLTGSNIKYGIVPRTNDSAYAEYRKNEKTLIGELKSMIRYRRIFKGNTDLLFYPTSIGTNCEVIFTKESPEEIFFTLTCDTAEIKVRKEAGGYLILYTLERVNEQEREQIVAIVQAPLLIDRQGEFSIQSKVDIKATLQEGYLIGFRFDSAYVGEGSRALISFEVRVEKQPDNTLYSGKPDLENAYLSNTYLLGKHEEYGVGRSLIRFQFANYFGLKAENIRKVKYYTYNLSTKPLPEFQILEVMDDWCSMTGNWSKGYRTGTVIDVLEGKQGEMAWDITTAARKWCTDASGQWDA